MSTATEVRDLLAALRGMDIEVASDNEVTIDVSRIAGPHHPHTWRLHREDGSWHHWQSGTSASLAEQIAAIALCHLDRLTIHTDEVVGAEPADDTARALAVADAVRQLWAEYEHSNSPERDMLATINQRVARLTGEGDET